MCEHDCGDVQLALKFAELQYYIVRIGALMSNSQ